jgi:hypothetical protein
MMRISHSYRLFSSTRPACPGRVSDQSLATAYAEL